ncbi:MAG: transcriptional repressor NrdR [Phycisphaerae bacterium]|nr:transcriptional repressor NrdR [Phycisphaerae bacterium]
MICPFCQSNDDKVIDSRSSEGGRVIRRRRECLSCRKRFTTYERVDELPRLMVVKRDGARVPFNRDNILRGVMVACGKRPIPQDVKTRLVDEIEEQVAREYEREVPSSVIGALVCLRLRDIDEVAYIRFASEHHRFQSKDELLSELHALTSRPKNVKDQQSLF